MHDSQISSLCILGLEFEKGEVFACKTLEDPDDPDNQSYFISFGSLESIEADPKAELISQNRSDIQTLANSPLCLNQEAVNIVLNRQDYHAKSKEPTNAFSDLAQMYCGLD